MIDAPLLNYLEGQKLKEEGITLASYDQQDWVCKAQSVAAHLAAQNGEVTINDVYAKIGLPDRPNAAGAVFRGGKFRCVGFDESARVKRRGGLIRRWALA